MHNYSPRHLDTAVSFLSQHSPSSSCLSPLPFDDLVDPEAFPLEALDRAVERAKEGKYPRVSVIFP